MKMRLPKVSLAVCFVMIGIGLSVAPSSHFVGMPAPVYAAEAVGSSQDLASENAQLRKRVEDLEKEVARLRVLAGEVVPADRAAAAEAKVQVVKDEAGKIQTVKTQVSRLEILTGTTADHGLDVRYTDGQAKMIITGWFSGQLYNQVKEVELSLDGQTLILPVSKYYSRMQMIGQRNPRRVDDEVVSIDLSAEALNKIASSTNVNGQMGMTRFSFSPEQIAIFKAVAARLAQ